MKSKQAKSTIGKAWSKFFHTEVIPGVKADNQYFIMACKKTQWWGKLGSHYYLCVKWFVSCTYYLCIFVGEGIMILTGREINDTYFDSNEENIKKQFEKFKEE
jgi:hypothetical protein